MALKFLDSFDHYATAQLGLKWSAVGSQFSIGSGNGRNGTNGAHLTPQGNSGNNYLSFVVPSQATYIQGCAIKVGSLTNIGPWPLLHFTDTATVQVTIAVLANGTVAAYRGNLATLLGVSSSAIFQVGTYVYIEALVTINATTGVVTVRANGAPVLSLSGVNTQSSGNAFANTLGLGVPAGTPIATSPSGIDYDDYALLDTTGTVNNTFLGDCRVQAIMPNGPGASTQFAVVGAAANWQAVDEIPPDGDTSYVSSSTAGQIDLYTVGSVTPTSGTVPAVQTCLYARKDDAGTRTIQPEIRQGATNYAVGSQHNLSTSYTYYLDVLEADPTGAPWTIANVNGDQYGVQEVA